MHKLEYTIQFTSQRLQLFSLYIYMFPEKLTRGKIYYTKREGMFQI